MKLKYIAPLIISFSAFADLTWYYSESTPYRIGRSHDVNFPLSRKENCLIEETPIWSTVDQGVGTISYDAKFLQKREELTEKMSIDLKLAAKAKFKLVSGEAKFDNKLTKEFAGFSDSINYLIQAKYNYGEKELLDPKLKPKYQAMIDSGDYQGFIKKCGTHFAVAARYGVEINVLMKIVKLSRDEKKNIKSKLNVSLKYGPVEGSLDTEFVKDYNEIKKSTESYLKVDTIGGPDKNFQAFGDTNDLKGLLAAIKTYMGGIKKETAHPIKFTLVSMERFGLIMPAYDPLKDEYFVEAYREALELDLTIDRIDHEISKLRQLNNDNANASIKDLRIARSRLQRWRAILDKQVNNCVELNSCDPKHLVSRQINVAWPSEVIKNLNGIKVCYGSPVTNIVTFILEGELNYPGLLEDVELFRSTKRDGVEPLPGNFLKKLNITKSRKRFTGVVQDLYVGEDDFYLLPEQNLHYIMKVRDTLDNTKSYKINFKSDPESDLACTDY